MLTPLSAVTPTRIGAAQATGWQSPWQVLRAITNLPVDAGGAPLLAMAAGAGAGSMMSLLCQGARGGVADAVFGAALGAVYHQIAKGRHGDAQRNDERWERLNRYPNMQQWLQREGLTRAHRSEIAHAHDVMQLLVDRITGHFRAYCSERALYCDPRVIEDITTFCMQHCIDRGPFMALQPEHGCYYLAAIDPEARGGLSAAVRADQLSGASFSQRGFTYIRGPLVRETDHLAQGAPREVPVRCAESAPQPLLADCYRPSREPLVAVRQRRSSNLRPTAAGRRPTRWWEH